MSATWFPASSITPLATASVQAITGYVDGDKAVVELDGRLRLYKFVAGSTLVDDGDNILTPDDGVTAGRWLRLQVDANRSQNGFDDAESDPQSDSTISFDAGTRTFTIAPTGDTFKFYVENEAFYNEGDTVVITDVEGLHWIYFDNDGDLKAQAPGGSIDALILTKCLVAAIYWDATNNLGIRVLDERHGSVMDPATHYHFHEIIGAQWESGGSLGDMDVDGSGNDASAAQFSVASTEIHDEDVEHSVSDGSPQDIGSPAEIPVFYRLGASGDWRKITATTYPIHPTGTGRAAWNENTGATWQITEVGNNDFVLMHYFMTNDISEPVIGIMGQGDYATVAQAREGAETELASLALGSLPGPEMVPLATVIFQTSDSYSNAVKSRVRSTDGGDDYIDWRSTSLNAAAGTSATSHEDLSDLFGGAGGDHYHLTSAQHTDLTDGDLATSHKHDGIFYDAATEVLEALSVGVQVNGRLNISRDGEHIYLVDEGAADTNDLISIRFNSPELSIRLWDDSDAAYDDLIKFTQDGAIDLYHASVNVLSTFSDGLHFRTTTAYLRNSGYNPVLKAVNGNETELLHDGTAELQTGVGYIDALNGLKIGTSTVTADDILDEDAMGSNSATALATQQSIKAYVDSVAGGSFPAGTKMYFYQAAAPTGWTIDNTLGDAVLAVHGSSSYHGSASGGVRDGSWTLTGITATAGNTGAHVLTDAEMNTIDIYHTDTHEPGKLGATYQGTYGTVAQTGTAKCIAQTGSNFSNRLKPDGRSRGTSSSSHSHTGSTITMNLSNTYRPYANVGIIATKD